MPPGAPPRAPRTAPGLHFYRFWGAFFVRFLSFFDTLNAKGRRKKMQKKPAFRFVFEDFLVTKLQAQYRIVTEPCGPLLTGMGTVAGRPKAIGYAAPVPGRWRDSE